MTRISNGEVPAGVEKVRRRFDDWRRGHRARSRLPERLWASAVELGCAYGINRTARALRLDYYSLKKRVESSSLKKRVESVLPATPRRKAATPQRQATAAPGDPQGPASAAFLEVGPLASAVAGECIVEWEDGEGAKMRVQLKGAEAVERVASELAALARSFWGIST